MRERIVFCLLFAACLFVGLSSSKGADAVQVQDIHIEVCDFQVDADILSDVAIASVIVVDVGKDSISTSYTNTQLFAAITPEKPWRLLLLNRYVGNTMVRTYLLGYQHRYRYHT